jgi:hypothetical protein
VNPNARKRLTDMTLIALAARLTAAEIRTSDGGIPIVIPRQMVKDIHALAYDRSKHIARKARLDTAVIAS